MDNSTTQKVEIDSDDKKRLISNFISLLVLQGSNYILPLLTLPYLVRILGVEYFGLLAFATATIAYFQILTDYGFNLTATKEVSIHRNDKQKLVEIFSSVMIIKFLLMLLSFVILCIVVFSFDRFRKDYLVFILSFGMVIGQVLFPVWFFQGMEKMKYVTYLNILAKSIFTVAIFLVVKEQSDYYIVPLLTSIGFIISGLLAFYLIKKEFDISFKLQSFKTIKYYLVDGWHVFLSRFYISVYTTTNIILLGIFTNNTIVGYYSIAEKIVMAIGGLFEPANQTLYPYLVKIYHNNLKQFTTMLKKISISYLCIVIFLFIMAEIFRNQLIYLVAGKHSESISSILFILLFLLFNSPFGSLYSNSLIIMHRKSEFLKVMNCTIILNFIIVVPSLYFYGVIGFAYSFVTLLIAHIFFLIYYLNRSINLTKNTAVTLTRACP